MKSKILLLIIFVFFSFLFFLTKAISPVYAQCAGSGSYCWSSVTNYGTCPNGDSFINSGGVYCVSLLQNPNAFCCQPGGGSGVVFTCQYDPITAFCSTGPCGYGYQYTTYYTCDPALYDGCCQACMPKQTCDASSGGAYIPNGNCGWTLCPNQCNQYTCTQTSCSAPSNTCYSGNGSYTRTCNLTLYNGSTNCVDYTGPVIRSQLSCTLDRCYAGYTCPAGTCLGTINVHVYIDYGHDGSNDANYPYGIVTINGGNAQTTGADGTVTYQEPTGTYTIAYNDNSPDYQQTAATSQSVTLNAGTSNVTVYFRVTPLYRVSGNLFNDNNHNANYDGGDSLFTQGTTTVHVSGGPTAVADMTQTDGTYTTPESLWSGTYTFTQTHTLPTGYTYTTPTSWTVTVGNVGAPGPHCSVGTSPDGVCGNPNNGSISNLNFGINPPYQISGTVFNDANKDQKYNNPPDTPFDQKPSIRITGPSNMTVAADAAGNYTTGQVLPPGTYTVAYNTALPTSYSFTTPSTWAVTVGYNPACNKGASLDASCGDPNGGSVNNLDFGVTNENPWHQEVCLDVRNDSGTYQDQIPPAPSCGGVSGAYNTITNGTCSTGAGIVFTCNATGDFGFGQANVNNWTAGGTTAQTQECYNNAGLDVIRTSYEYLETTARQSNITPIDMNSVSVCGAGGIANCTLAGGLAKGIYQANGTVNLNGYVFPAPSNPSTQAYSYIFLIKGDLHINGNILIPKGSVAVFSTSGNIYVDKSVGQVVINSSDPSVNNPNIEGLYSADGNFIIQSYGVNGNYCNANGTPLDKKLNIIGSIVTNASKSGTGGLINNRDLCIFDFDCSSASVGDGTGTSGSGASGVSGATGPGTVINYLLTLLADGQFLNHNIQHF